LKSLQESFNCEVALICEFIDVAKEIFQPLLLFVEADFQTCQSVFVAFALGESNLSCF
jgi:hypothetical protein